MGGFDAGWGRGFVWQRGFVNFLAGSCWVGGELFLLKGVGDVVGVVVVGLVVVLDVVWLGCG